MPLRTQKTAFDGKRKAGGLALKPNLKGGVWGRDEDNERTLDFCFPGVGGNLIEIFAGGNQTVAGRTDPLPFVLMTALAKPFPLGA